MKFHWIHQNKNPHLIIFFNGWGMDQYPVESLQRHPDDDILMFYDYRNLDMETSLLLRLHDYNDLSVIAWSMGVWAYAQLQDRFSDQIRCAVALNGTCQPIHEKHGIPPQVYQATLDHFSEKGRNKFFKRMCVSQEVFTRFQRYQPQRMLSEQQEELAAIQYFTLTQPYPEPCYDYALIAREDRIIPTQHQCDFWNGNNPYTLIDAPHFPFFLWKSWRAILDHATEHS